MSDLNAQLTPAQVAAAEIRVAHEGYLHRVAVAFDQFINSTAGGKDDETISAHAQRLSDAGNVLGKTLTEALDLLQKSHGRLAEVGDMTRGEAVTATEQKALEP
jgi:hypothetical protein